MDSMVNQTVSPGEYVIVEDGPIPDELEEVINEYCRKYHYFKIVRLKENSGCGPASIAGMKECSYDLIARIDSDDISLPHRCELELELFENDPELAVVGSSMLEFEGSPDNIVSVKKMPTEPETIYEFGKRRSPINHSTAMLRKSIIDQFGGYAPIRRSLDLELFTKLLFNGCKFKNIEEPLVKFRCGGERIKRKKNWTNFKNDLRVYKRNKDVKYMSSLDYLYVVLRQIVFFILPNRIAHYLYIKIYRGKVQ